MQLEHFLSTSRIRTIYHFYSCYSKRSNPLFNVLTRKTTHPFSLQGGLQYWVFVNSRIMAPVLVSKIFGFLRSKPTRGGPCTPERYLELTKTHMVQVEKMTSPKLNFEQCKYLAAILKSAVESATLFLELLNKGHFFPSPEEGKEICLGTTFRLLLALAMEVENFIKNCCTDRWIQSAFTLTTVAEHVLSLSFDLKLWTLLFSDIKQSRACRSRRTQEEVDGFFKAEAETVEEKASLDRGILLGDLDSVLRRQDPINTDHQLAAYMKDLLERFEKSRPVAASAPPELSHSKLFETVTQMKQIGKGACATVSKAKWLGSEVAVKTFCGPGNPYFEKEVSVLIGLSHPNIVSLMGYKADERNCSIFMELLDKSLRTLMDERLAGGSLNRCSPFDILEGVDIMLQVGEGMRYVHKMRIVHRDLKSDNILVRCLREPELHIELVVAAKVADFGLSMTKERSITYSDQMPNAGTTRWMAPELMKSSSAESEKEKAEGESMALKYPFKSDIYSFALVCYEILSGNQPFPSIYDPKKIRSMVLNGERPELPEACPLLLKNLIERCWSQDASKRPSFREICVELRHVKCSLIMPSILEKVSPALSNPVQPSTKHDNVGEIEVLAKVSSTTNNPLQPSINHVNGEEIESGSMNISSMGNFGYLLRQVPRKILGMEDHFKRLQSSIIEGHASQISTCVGIQGMGGAGKTLLAQLVNNDKEIHKVFGEKSIIWITVGCDGSVPSIYVQMRNYLQVGTISDGISLEDQCDNLIKSFSSQRILLILDDVWDNVYKHREMIEWLNIATGPGSVTLITTRMKSITSKSCGGVEVVLGLSEEQSWELFCTHAFGIDALPLSKSYLEEVAKDVCNECKCLPLALKVIGLAMKSKRDIADWRRTLRRLQDSTMVTKSVEGQLFGRLRISYDQLDESTKICFLYFAAFPEDCDIPVELLSQIWVAEGIFGEDLDEKEALDEALWALNELRQLSLIEDSSSHYDGNNKCVKMHDILRDLAINITRQGDVCTRDSLFELKRKDLEKLPGSWLRSPLKVKRMSLWGNNIQRFHDNFPAPSLRICILYPTPWRYDGWSYTDQECIMEEDFFHHLEDLRFFQFCYSCTLIKLPSKIGRLGSLQHLNLAGCEALKEVPESIGQLRSLQHLNLRACRALKEVPESIGRLGSLQHLNLQWCRALKEVPESIGQLGSLQYLNLVECEALEELPESIGQLGSLQHLNLAGCEALKEVPESIGQLQSLQHLNLRACRALKEVPESIGQLGSLQHLNLRACRALKEVPESIGQLRSLQYLNLRACSALKEVPESIGQLGSLQHLNLAGCEALKEVPESIGQLRSLQHLNITACVALKDVPESIGQLGSLQHLNLAGCVALKEVPESIGRLGSLQYLNLAGCVALKEVPENIERFGSLKHLNLRACRALKEVPESIRQLESLQHLNLAGCVALKEVPESIGQLGSLQHLNLLWCRALKEVPESIGQLGSLQYLNLAGCEALEELPKSIRQLGSLQHLNITACIALKEVPESIGQLGSLQHLSLGWCGLLKEVPESIGQLGSLQHLNLQGCRALKEVPESIGQLGSLQHLNLAGCEALEELPKSIRQLESLQYLNLQGCRALKEVPESIGQLGSLQHLNLAGCEALEELPKSIRQLGSLQYLNLQGCRALKEVPESIGQLGSFQHLNLEGLKELFRACHY